MRQQKMSRRCCCSASQCRSQYLFIDELPPPTTTYHVYRPIGGAEARLNATMAVMSGGITISGDDPRAWSSVERQDLAKRCLPPLEGQCCTPLFWLAGSCCVCVVVLAQLYWRVTL